MKKNTLLYLDSDLVDKAKEAGINISRFVEDKLSHELRAARPKTAREYLQRVIADTAERGASFFGEAYMLPFQIESLKLENIGLFKSFEVEFKKDAVNVISGSNGSGKSTIIRSILLALGKRHKQFPKSDNGKITLKLFQSESAVTITTNEELEDRVTNGYRCLIADDFLQATTIDMAKAVMQELSRLKAQAIIATTRELASSNLPKNANMISLPNIGTRNSQNEN
jgi:post-segregation antitoxin (ccd killing protein)